MSELENPQSVATTQPPTMIIDAPPNYEQTHKLLECPLCDCPNPFLNMYILVQGVGLFRYMPVYLRHFLRM